MYIENIVIGNPLVSLEMLLGSEQYPEYNFMDCTVKDDERYLPKLLARHGFTSSAKEIRRNRKDLDVILEHPDFIEIKLGKRRIWIVVGE